MCILDHLSIAITEVAQSVLETMASLGQKGFGQYLLPGILVHFCQLIDTEGARARLTMVCCCCCCCSFQAISMNRNSHFMLMPQDFQPSVTFKPFSIHYEK